MISGDLRTARRDSGRSRRGAVRRPPSSVMLLEEAAQRAGVAAQLPMLGRPTCMAIPAALAQGTVASAGCIGNRIYTGLSENELYVAVPGKDLERIAAEMDTILVANFKLADYHRERRRTLESEG